MQYKITITTDEGATLEASRPEGGGLYDFLDDAKRLLVEAGYAEQAYDLDFVSAEERKVLDWGGF